MDIDNKYAREKLGYILLISFSIAAIITFLSIGIYQRFKNKSPKETQIIDVERDKAEIVWRVRSKHLATWILCGNDMKIDSFEETQRRFEEAIPFELENEIKVAWGPTYTRSAFLDMLIEQERKTWLENEFKEILIQTHIDMKK